MADWSMEPAAVWMPYGLQLTNWAMKPAVCAPGYPIEYASTEVFGSCHQISVPICGEGQLCESEVATQHDTIETPKQEVVVDFHDVKEILRRLTPMQVFNIVANDCNKDAENTKKKIHRYPASIRALGLDKRYTSPTVVAIGPYYHGRDELKQAEKMKHVSAYQCIKDSGYPVEDFYNAVVPLAHDVRSLYDKDVEARIRYDDFLHMMFFDACFLVQYMLIMSDRKACVTEMQESLFSFFDTYDNEIFHDIMLFENQIPWPVVETVMKLMNNPVDLEKFIHSLKDCLQDRKRKDHFRMDGSYQPPHLLGLLRYYIVGSSKTETEALPDQISLSVSANELAEIGIKLKANENTELVHMGVKMKQPFFGELFLAPLSLDDARASCLISMAAFELCITSNFQDEEDEASAVCSYLLLLAMLVATEEDVQKLRTKQILRGAGLANKEVVDLFSTIHGLRLGSCYVRTMIQIERYTNTRRTRTNLYSRYYRNKTTIAKVGSVVVGTLGIIGTIIGAVKDLKSS